MCFPPRYATLAAFCIATVVGCRDDQSIDRANVASSANTPVDLPSLSTAERLSVAEYERIQGVIDAVGGKVICNPQGDVIGVDVARRQTPIDEDILRTILKFPQLSVLRLSVHTVSTETLDELASQSHLREFLLRDAPLDDTQLIVLLKGLPALKRLSLHRLNRITDKAMDAIVPLDQLAVVALIDLEVTGHSLTQLQKLPRLRSLDLRYCTRLQVEDYQELLKFKSLTELKLGGSKVDNRVVEQVAMLPKLTSLGLEDSPASASAFQQLATPPERAKRIESLAITRCYGVTDDALSVITKMPNLTTLSIRECPVTDAFLTKLSKPPFDHHPKLQTLVVSNAFLTEDAFVALERFANSLRRLDLTGVALSSDSMISVGKLWQLRTLRLSNCSLRDEAIEPIGSLTNLVTLDLSDNHDITNKSAKILAELPQLKRIHTNNTGISRLPFESQTP